MFYVAEIDFEWDFYKRKNVAKFFIEYRGHRAAMYRTAQWARKRGYKYPPLTSDPLLGCWYLRTWKVHKYVWWRLKCTLKSLITMPK